MFLDVWEERPEGKRQHQAGDEGHAHVQRGVNAQIHARKGDEQYNDRADRAPERAARPHAQAAEAGEGVLRVPAGEGVAGSLRPSALHDGELRVLHPGARYAAGDLQELVEDRAREADGEYVIAQPLADAPEDDDCGRHVYHLPAQLGDGGHDGVQYGGAYILQRV